jgi:8-oxo-dGTP diphosphatase
MYATCSRGHRHWGVFGAAGGLLVVAGAREPEVLLTLRSAQVHLGNTWSVPGGAIDLDDADTYAAVRREIREELGLDVSAMPEVGWHHFECGGWGYSTVLLAAPARLAPVRLGWETEQVGWFPLSGVDTLAAEGSLHPGFASSWPALRRLAAGRQPGAPPTCGPEATRYSTRRPR